MSLSLMRATTRVHHPGESAPRECRWLFEIHIELFKLVMAGLDPAIYVLATEKKVVDARVKPGHDEC